LVRDLSKEKAGKEPFFPKLSQRKRSVKVGCIKLLTDMLNYIRSAI
jgi:hypothetical protein